MTFAISDLSVSPFPKLADLLIYHAPKWRLRAFVGLFSKKNCRRFSVSRDLVSLKMLKFALTIYTCQQDTLCLCDLSIGFLLSSFESVDLFSANTESLAKTWFYPLNWNLSQTWNAPWCHWFWLKVIISRNFFLHNYMCNFPPWPQLKIVQCRGVSKLGQLDYAPCIQKLIVQVLKLGLQLWELSINKVLFLHNWKLLFFSLKHWTINFTPIEAIEPNYSRRLLNLSEE